MKLKGIFVPPMKNLLLIVTLLFSNIILAQVSDNFNDGDFKTAPEWDGDTLKFLVNNNYQLQLNNAAIADDAALTVKASISDSTSWSFYVKLTFSPSATNYIKIYLQSDQQNIKGSLNGYFIKIGENGSNDAINLYEQSGTTEKLIVQGIKGRAAVNPLFHIKIIRDNSGNWSVYSDSTGGNNFLLEGIGFSNKHKAGNYFGIICKHTSTNAKKFFFDDLYIHPVFTDTVPPTIAALSIIDMSTLEIIFSEKIDSISAASALKFFINNGIGNPFSVQRDSVNINMVRLKLTSPLSNKQSYRLSAYNISDEYGNIQSIDSIDFYYFKPAFKDIVINEIMADPSPPVDLPEAEYVELYNTSDVAINLKNWKFSDASSTTVLPDVTIPADSFLILISNANFSEFSGYGLVAGVPSLPSLNNSSDELKLSDPEGTLIHIVEYTDQWYRDSKKKQGGWSLELIDAENECDVNTNWIASIDISGGTPGRRNSVVALVDTNLIAIKTILPKSDSIILIFNKSFKAISVSDKLNYQVENGISVISVSVISSENKVVLKLDQQLQEEKSYSLAIKDIKDCKGQTVDSLKIYYFSLPQRAIFFDIVINEIMADPDPAVALPSIEYVELFNRTNKSINLKQWKLSDGKEAVFPEIIIEPYSYLIVAPAGKDSNFIRFGKTIGIPNWPALNNDEDKLFLIDDQDKLIHSVHYSDNWYGSKIKKDGGWSLEMVDPDNPCGSASNWKASNNNNGGTPGKVNSVFGKNPDTKMPHLIAAYALDENSIVAVFNEALNPSAVSVTSFHIKKGIGNPYEISFLNNDFKKVQLQLNHPLERNTIYDLEVMEVTDCAGNKISKTTVAFGLSEPAAPSDIIVNEILYNPDKGGVDFVEIYNNSNKIINLQDLFIAKTSVTEEVLDYTSIQSKPFLILPGEYFAMTSDPALILNSYYIADQTRIILTPKLPNYLDNEGGVAVLNKFTEVIDFVYYYSSWEHPFIDDHNGISLERISFNAKSNEKSNWHSAATKVRATPGYQNSQIASSKTILANISVDPEVFSPDGDGYNDVLKIHYNFEEAGNIVSVTIFDAKGQLTRHIIKNEMLEQQGFLIWDGINQAQEKASIGIYIIYIEGYNSKGQAFSQKIRCVVGGIL